MRRAWLLSLGLITLTSGALATEDVGTLLEQRLGSENAAQAEQEQAAIAKGKRMATLATGQAVLKDLDSLQSAVERWEGQVNRLLTGDEGRALASDPVSVQNVITLKDRPRPEAAQVAGWRAQVQTLLAPLEQAPENSLYTPGPGLQAELLGVGRQVKDGLSTYERLQNQWRVLVQRGQGTPVPANGPTLAEAIERDRNARAQQELDAERAAREEAQRLARQRIAEEEARKQEEIARQKIERIRQERETIQQDTALANDSAEHQRLLKEARDPARLRRFAPFLAKAPRVLKQRGAHSNRKEGPTRNGHWPRSEHGLPEPLSLGHILSWEASSDVHMLVRIAMTGENPRPRGAFRLIRTEQDVQDMQKLLDEFNRYSGAWVELGLLKP